MDWCLIERKGNTVWTELCRNSREISTENDVACLKKGHAYMECTLRHNSPRHVSLMECQCCGELRHLAASYSTESFPVYFLEALSTDTNNWRDRGVRIEGLCLTWKVFNSDNKKELNGVVLIMNSRKQKDLVWTAKSWAWYLFQNYCKVIWHFLIIITQISLMIL